MKTKILFFLLLIKFSDCLSQTNYGLLQISDYKQIEIVNTSESQSIKLMEIEKQPIDGSWSQIVSFLGISSPSCNNNDAGNNCYFRQAGIEIYFSDRLGDFTMGKLSIDSQNFGMKLNGNTIKVGDDISKISLVHQEAYNKRHSMSTRNGNIHQVLFRLEYVDTTISFEYDISTNKITLIEVFSPLT